MGVAYRLANRNDKLKITNVSGGDGEVQQYEMLEEYIEEYDEAAGGEPMEWNYGVEVIKNEKN